MNGPDETTAHYFEGPDRELRSRSEDPVAAAISDCIASGRCDIKPDEAARCDDASGQVRVDGATYQFSSRYSWDGEAYISMKVVRK